MIGALIVRELAISLRRGTVHVLVFAHALLTLALVVVAERLVRQATPLNPPSIGASSPPSQTGLAGAIAADVGVSLLFGFTCWMLLVCIAVAPSIGGQAVARERERGLLEMLLSAGATPVTIVVAKVVAILAQTGIVLLSGLPALAFIFVFSDVPARLLLGSIALLLAWSLVVGAVSICCSTWARSGVGGVIAAFVGALALFVTVLTTSVLAVRFGEGMPAFAHALNPFVAVLALEPDLGQRLIALLPLDAWPSKTAPSALYTPYALTAFVVGCLAVTTALLVVASFRVRR